MNKPASPNTVQAKPNLKPQANFLFEVGLLAKTPRSGFRFLSSSYQESISEHLLRTTYIGFVLADLEISQGHTINLQQVLENCLFHDFGEARGGDLDYVSQKYSTSDEFQAIKDSVAHLPFGQRILNAYQQTEDKSTPEGIIAKDADQLEMLLSLKEIIDSGNTQAQEWIPNLIKRFRLQSSKDLAQTILQTDSNEWWFQDKDGDYWVKGGKNHSDTNS